MLGLTRDGRPVRRAIPPRPRPCTKRARRIPMPTPMSGHRCIGTARAQTGRQRSHPCTPPLRPAGLRPLEREGSVRAGRERARLPTGPGTRIARACAQRRSSTLIHNTHASISTAQTEPRGARVDERTNTRALPSARHTRAAHPAASLGRSVDSNDSLRAMRLSARPKGWRSARRRGIAMDSRLEGPARVIETAV